MRLDVFSFLFGFALNWVAEGIFLLVQFLRNKFWHKEVK